MTDEIKVTYTETWDDCEHAGCSGPEIHTITAVRGDRSVSASNGSCFGVSKEELIAELLTKWTSGDLERACAWAISKGYVTGHADTIEELLGEIEWQAIERGKPPVDCIGNHFKNDAMTAPDLQRYPVKAGDSLQSEIHANEPSYADTCYWVDDELKGNR